jgi:hypothetical protein
MRGKSVLAVLWSATAAVLLTATPSAAKEVNAIEIASVGKPVQVGPYTVTVKRLTLNGSGELRSLDSVRFSITNRTARRVRMPGALAACQGADTWEGTSLIPGSARREWLGPKQALRGVQYRFESSGQRCAVPEARLGLEVPPDSGRFTQLRVAVDDAATSSSGCPKGQVPSPLLSGPRCVGAKGPT